MAIEKARPFAKNDKGGQLVTNGSVYLRRIWYAGNQKMQTLCRLAFRDAARPLFQLIGLEVQNIGTCSNCGIRVFIN